MSCIGCIFCGDMSNLTMAGETVADESDQDYAESLSS